MSQLVTDCPRCSASHTTFEVRASHVVFKQQSERTGSEVFAVCRHCRRATIFKLIQKNTGSTHDNMAAKGLEHVIGSVLEFTELRGYVSIADNATFDPPDHLPSHIDAAFREAATSASVGCYNAAGAMYRLCVDHATKALLPANNPEGLNASIRRSLGHRLSWLFETTRLPSGLRELSDAIKEDGNDGAHAGSLSRHDAEDLKDFTVALLERLYTEPERLRLAQERRRTRRET